MAEASRKAMEMRAILSAQIRFWMQRFDWDIKTLAEKANLSERNIYRLRSNEIGASTDSIADLAAAFGIHPAVLLMPVAPDNGADDRADAINVDILRGE